MILTCINASYTGKAATVIAENNFIIPEVGKEYTIREIMLMRDEYVLLLNEIKNKQLVIGGPEIGFHYSRFTDQPNNVLAWETVHELYKQQQLQL